MTSAAQRHDWQVVPITVPKAIEPPPRINEPAEYEHIRVGTIPRNMDEKWFIFAEGDTVLFHRSWTGHGIFEATFEPCDGGHRIARLIVTDDSYRYQRGSDAEAASALERTIDAILLRG